MKKIFVVAGFILFAIFALYSRRQADTPVEKKDGAPGAQLAPSISDTRVFSAPTVTPPAKSYSIITLKRVRRLKEILDSHGDNDPSLDRDFENLPEETKQAFRDEYSKRKLEARNERGTIIYVLGKSISAPEDFNFLKLVLEEASCLSLEDCAAASNSSDDSHLAGVEDVTLVYPQLVALDRIEAWIKSIDPVKADRTLTVAADEALQSALRSPNPRIVKKANAVFALFRKIFG